MLFCNKIKKNFLLLIVYAYRLYIKDSLKLFSSNKKFFCTIVLFIYNVNQI